MSWKAEVLVGGDPKWYDNGLRFQTQVEAEGYVRDLEGRWTSVRKTRTAEVEEDWNSFWREGRAIRKEEVQDKNYWVGTGRAGNGGDI